MYAYDRNDLKRIFGVSSATLRFLARAGYIKSAAPPDRPAYSFQELLVLRTVGALMAAKIPTRQINRALRQLRPWLSDDLPMHRLALDAIGNLIRVRTGDASWEPASGQYALALDVPAARANIVAICNREVSMKSTQSAHEQYLRGTELEEADLTAARAAYEACLAGDCTHLEARINLGRLLHLEGRLREAESTYRGTKEPNATLLFNLAVLLEDLERDGEAAAAYREALIHDPALADAHFNLSLLYERAGDVQTSFRHLLAYHRLTRQFAS